tara:strand:- start:3737 stop:6538 length:2802 start_codon:yes stop_codon:yes gene_type:complete
MKLINLLEKYKWNENNSHKTHTIIPNFDNKEYKFGASYYIPTDLSTELVDIFYNYYFKNGGKLSITEAIPDITPLLIDLDFEFDGTTRDKQLTNDIINNIVEFIYKNIEEYFEVKDILNTKCYIQEKSNPKTNSDGYTIKEGIHIIFPSIIGDKLVFKEFFKQLSDKKEVNDILDLFTSKPTNDATKIFDTNVSRWFIYGSTKPNDVSYKVTKVYNYLTEIENTLSDRELLDLFYLTKEYTKNIEYKKGIDKVLIKKDIVSSKCDYMSSLDCIELYEYSDEEEQEISNELQNVLKEDFIKNIKKIVLRCLSEERYNDYELWIKLGMCLKNIGNELFNVWNEFSKKSDSYESRNECLKKWESFSEHCNNPMTIRTLKYWARLDNLTEYNKITEESISDLVDRSVKEGGAHDDVAKVVYSYFKDDFVCADIKSNMWFNYDGTKWNKCSLGYKLQTELSKTVKLIYSNSEKRFRDSQNKRIEKGEPESEDIKKWEEIARKIYNKLKDVPFQKNIMEACRTKFYDETFLETMDSNTKLLCFDNCVFDLENNMIREGHPEDKLTISTKYELPILENELPVNVDKMWELIMTRDGLVRDNWEQYKPGKKIKPSKQFIKRSRELKDFLIKVLPDLSEIEENPGEIRSYCLKYIASRLCGNVSNRFSIWTGSGGNGKSILIDLIRYTLGSYCMNIPVTLLTQKRKSSNAACPEKARTRGARLCYMQEPDENEKINAGEMKELSGGDMILARNLYQEPFEFKPQFEIVLMCNDKPKIEDKTNGAWRRVQVYPFNSRFVDDPKEVNHDKNIYKADKSLQDIVPDWNVIFMGLLMKEWCMLDSNKIDIPKSIRMETENYKNHNDIIGQWLSDQVVECRDDTTSFRDLCNYYESWIELVYGKNIKIDKITFKDRLIAWQKQKFGFSDSINGTQTNPKINMIVKEE